jgi:hypothetical protein
MQSNMESYKSEGEIKFSALLEQIERSVNHKLYYVAVMASLAIPDIGGAINSNNGRTNKCEYVKWFNKYASPKYKVLNEQCLNGEECYYLRCSMLHQGTTQNEKLTKYLDIILCEVPQTLTPFPLFVTKNKVLLIEPKSFCNNMVFAAYDWLDEVHNEELFKKNTKNLMALFSLSFPGLS